MGIFHDEAKVTTIGLKDVFGATSRMMTEEVCWYQSCGDKGV